MDDLDFPSRGKLHNKRAERYRQLLKSGPERSDCEQRKRYRLLVAREKRKLARGHKPPSPDVPPSWSLSTTTNITTISELHDYVKANYLQFVGTDLGWELLRNIDGALRDWNVDDPPERCNEIDLSRVPFDPKEAADRRLRLKLIIESRRDWLKKRGAHTDKPPVTSTSKRKRNDDAQVQMVSVFLKHHGYDKDGHLIENFTPIDTSEFATNANASTGAVSGFFKRYFGDRSQYVRDCETQRLANKVVQLADEWIATAGGSCSEFTDS